MNDQEIAVPQPIKPKRQRGDGRVFKRGETFWCAYMHAGKEHRESCQTSDEKHAEKYLRSITKRLHAHEVQPDTIPFLTVRERKRTISEVMDAYKTHLEAEGKGSAQNLSTIKRVKEDFGDILAHLLTRDQIAAYVRDRRAEGLKAASVNRILQCLRAAFNYAELPAPKFDIASETGNVRTGFFTEQELTKIKAVLTADLSDFFQWCAATGMRRGEASQLRWEWIRDERLSVPGEFCKNGRPHNIALAGELAAIIARRREKRAGELVFHRDGKPVKEFRKSWSKACKLAGCPGRLFHDLRRTAARNLRRSGVDETTCMSITGHSGASMFRRYSIVDDSDQREAFARVEQMRKAQMDAYLAEQAKQAQARPDSEFGQKREVFGQSALQQVRGVVGNA
jgi:integrase